MRVYIVTENVCQSEYSEPRYWAAAKDSTEILDVFADRMDAEAYKKKCEEEAEDWGDDEDDDPRYWEIIEKDMYFGNKEGKENMKTLYRIYTEGIKDSDWTYIKPEYAPNGNCKVGIPEATPNGTLRDDVKTCYILTCKTAEGKVTCYDNMMYLSDNQFHWYGNLWGADETVDQELERDNTRHIEPIAWIEYRNLPEAERVAPCNDSAVPTPEGYFASLRVTLQKTAE